MEKVKKSQNSCAQRAGNFGIGRPSPEVAGALGSSERSGSISSIRKHHPIFIQLVFM